MRITNYPPLNIMNQTYLFLLPIVITISVISLIIGPRDVFALDSFENYFSKKGVSIQEQQQPNPAGIKFLGTSAFIIESGSLEIVGEIQNNQQQPIKYMDIVYTFYDINNNVTSTSSAITEKNFLRPGEKSAFFVVFSDPSQIEKSKKVKIAVNWEPADFDSYPAKLKLIIGHNYIEKSFVGNEYHIVGEVNNQGSEEAGLVKVSAAFYNKNNQVVSESSTVTKPEFIKPNQTASFDLSVLPTQGVIINSASINVESLQYSMTLPISKSLIFH